MTRDEFKVIVKGLKAVYSDPKFIADQFAFDMWFGLLGDLPYEVASMATKAYMQSESFAPTPAGIRSYSYKITSPVTEDKSEIEAWGLVERASHNGIYGAEEEFAKLPPLIQETLGSPARLREIANLSPDEVSTVEMSHFVRNYRAKLEQKRSRGRLDTQLQAQIEQTRQQNTPVLEVHEVEHKGIEIKENEETGFSQEIADMLDDFHKRLSETI